MNTIFTSKFIQLIKTFTEEDLKGFEMWLQSPWCNTNKNLPKLLEKLKKYYPDFENQKLTKEKLFYKILPNGKFSDRRMNNILSEGYLAAERFMIFQNLSKNQNLQKDLLTKELQNRHLEDWFFRDAQKEIDRLENKPIKDWEDHLDLLQLHRRIYHHPNQNPRMQPGGLTIVKMGEQIDLVYLLEKAAIINEKIFRNRILKNENHEVTSELKTWLLASEGIEHPAIDFYKMRFEYTEENMLEQYFKLREAFIERFEELNEKERQIHLLSLFNDSSILKRKGLTGINDSLINYKFGFESNILPINGNLSGVTYATTLMMSNASEDFNFSKNFVEEYTDYLPIHLREDAKNWAKAHINYRGGELEDSLRILLDNDFKVFYFQTISKILFLQVYFDLYLNNSSFYEYLIDYCNSFERWINREKLLNNVKKESYKKFIQKSKELVKICSIPSPNVELLSSFLQGEKNIEARGWLMKKKNEILVLIKNKELPLM